MRSLCVFCGSNPGSNPAYTAAARELGTTLAQRGIRLVYGGGSVGLMGEVADAVLDRAVGDALLRPQHRAVAIVESEVSALLARLAAWEPPRVEKWIRRGEE